MASDAFTLEENRLDMAAIYRAAEKSLAREVVGYRNYGRMQEAEIASRRAETAHMLAARCEKGERIR